MHNDRFGIAQPRGCLSGVPPDLFDRSVYFSGHISGCIPFWDLPYSKAVEGQLRTC